MPIGYGVRNPRTFLPGDGALRRLGCRRPVSLAVVLCRPPTPPATYRRLPVSPASPAATDFGSEPDGSHRLQCLDPVWPTLPEVCSDS
jgi:hypothetical protein